MSNISKLSVKIKKVSPYTLVKVQKGMVITLKKGWFSPVFEKARKIVKQEGNTLTFLQNAWFVCDAYDVKKALASSIYHIIRTKENQRVKLSKPIYSITTRDLCKQLKIPKITIPTGVSPLYYMDEVAVGISGQNSFCIIKKEQLNKAYDWKLKLKAEKQFSSKKRLLI